jgi:pentatricopeptide repeat protein
VSKKERLQILQLAVEKCVKRYIIFLLVSDAQKVVEAVKMYKLMNKYGCVLTQHMEAANKYIKDKKIEYTTVSISVHVS